MLRYNFEVCICHLFVEQRQKMLRNSQFVLEELFGLEITQVFSVTPCGLARTTSGTSATVLKLLMHSLQIRASGESEGDSFAPGDGGLSSSSSSTSLRRPPRPEDETSRRIRYQSTCMQKQCNNNIINVHKISRGYIYSSRDRR